MEYANYGEVFVFVQKYVNTESQRILTRTGEGEMTKAFFAFLESISFLICIGFWAYVTVPFRWVFLGVAVIILVMMIEDGEGGKDE